MGLGARRGGGARVALVTQRALTCGDATRDAPSALDATSIDAYWGLSCLCQHVACGYATRDVCSAVDAVSIDAHVSMRLACLRHVLRS